MGKKYGLSGSERIKQRKDFGEIYSNGRTIFSQDRKLKCIFLSEPAYCGQLKMATAVSRQAGIAVWRNRTERLIKESFRLNKGTLLETCMSKNIYLRLILSPLSLNQKNAEKIKRMEIESSLIDILNKVMKII